MHVSGDNRTFGTDHHTGGFHAKLGAVSAVIALGGGMTGGVNVERIIGTRLHTRFAADAAIGVKIYNAVGSLIQRFCGADSDARRVVTVVAAIYQKIATRIGKLTTLNILDPCPIHAQRHIMFGFARDCAGMAADALALVNDEGIFGHTACFLSSLQDAYTPFTALLTSRKACSFTVLFLELFQPLR
ncbi:MAG: hypothetical protein PVS3B3_23770 [Ktedonobacteraceae bacterium]